MSGCGGKEKNSHSWQETNLSSNVRQLAGSGIKTSYKVQNKLKCQSFVIGHSTPSFSWRSNICLHSSPQPYSHFSQHTTFSNSYLSWITLRVKYHHKILNFSSFTVFIKIRDLLTLLMYMKSYLIQSLKFYFETHFMDVNKIWYRKSPLKLCTLHFSLNLFNRTSNIYMVIVLCFYQMLTKNEKCPNKHYRWLTR